MVHLRNRTDIIGIVSRLWAGR